MMLNFRYATIAAALLLIPAAASAQDSFTDKQRTEIGQIVRQYLLDNPEVLVEVSKELEIRQGALEAFRILGGRGWGRVDFLMDEAGNHYFLEVNTAPGMTDHSLVPMAARVNGLDYPALVRRVLELAAND